jgi:uncharacterized membrane protein YhaH (DUF805 family)
VIFLKRLFWLSGRAGRLEFLLTGIVVWNIYFGWLIANFVWVWETGGDHTKIAALAQFFGTPLFRLGRYACYVALWIAVANNFRRLHDLE